MFSHIELPCVDMTVRPRRRGSWGQLLRVDQLDVVTLGGDILSLGKAEEGCAEGGELVHSKFHMALRHGHTTWHV